VTVAYRRLKVTVANRGVLGVVGRGGANCVRPTSVPVTMGSVLSKEVDRADPQTHDVSQRARFTRQAGFAPTTEALSPMSWGIVRTTGN
jgi:hypothetical protein